MDQNIDIYEDLKSRLVSNDFPHGGRLRAEDLRKDYACSASTVREVLFRLSVEGLATFVEQRGFRVPEQAPALLVELTHLRVLLEAEGAALSIRYGGVPWEAKLTASHHQLSHIETRIRAHDNPADLVGIWFDAEKEFHETLISACGSDTLKMTHNSVYLRFRQQLMVADRRFDFISQNIDQHAQILDAALKGDEEQIRIKISDHLARHMRGDTQGVAAAE